MSDDSEPGDFAPDGTPLPGIDPDEVLHRVIAYAVARAEGTLAILAELEADNGKRGKRGNNNPKRHAYHAGIRFAAQALIQQMTAALAALQHATSRDEKYSIAVHAHQIDTAFSPYNLWGLSPVTEHAVSERQALLARSKRKPTPQRIAQKAAVDAAIADYLRSGKKGRDLKPRDLKDAVNLHLPADQPMRYSTLTDDIRGWKRDNGYLK